MDKTEDKGGALPIFIKPVTFIPSIRPDLSPVISAWTGTVLVWFSKALPMEKIFAVKFFPGRLVSEKSIF